MKNQLLNILSVLAITLSFSTFGQTYLGVHSSNYIGVKGTDFNPASFVDGRFLADINLGSFNFNAYQNAVEFDTKDMPKWWVKSFNDEQVYNSWAQPDSTFVNRYIVKNYDVNSDNKLGLYQTAQIDLLNFAFHVRPDIAVGFAAKYRMTTNLNDLDPKLAILAEEGLDYPSLWNQTFDEELLNLNHLSWMEYGIIYSQVLKDDGPHFFKAGGKLKGLSGISAGYIHTDNFSYNLLNSDTSQYLQGDFEYGHSKDLGDGSYDGGIPQSNSKFSVGLDLGVVYEWRPDWKEYKYDMDGKTNIWRRDQNKYKLRAGLSVLDIGRMKFTKGDYSRDFQVRSSNLFDLTVFDEASSLEEFNEKVDSLVENSAEWSSADGENQTFHMNLPTTLGLSLDYHIWKWIYLNASGTISLQSRKNAHRVRVANQFSLTPSFDHKWGGLYIPVSYNKYSGFKAGLGTRLGPLVVGVTDFKTLFATGMVNGAEFYAGLRLPILYTHPSDIDDDKVSDDLDKCKEIPGVWSFKGCPDTDGDGIQDTEDECPQTPGPKEMNGCPDADKDSIPDYKDDCPEIAGIREFKGCPDTDADGIKDSEDDCPEIAGPKENNGCPDTDGDGLFDFIDDCPTKPGPKENNGCPWADTDNDGLLDKDDKCPTIAGPIENEGCPYQDTDEDGVLDKEDKCPNTKGTIENDGCPEIEKEVQEVLKTAFDNLEFETAKDVIKQESIPSLKELAKVLEKRPEWKLQVAGHTDNVGDDQNNLVLSKKRAEAVKNYMISQNISAERLHVLYFGETQPIADNSTADGRQKNRRVEMKIIFD